jgi:hypothetical protein
MERGTKRHNPSISINRVQKRQKAMILGHCPDVLYAVQAQLSTALPWHTGSRKKKESFKTQKLMAL